MAYEKNKFDEIRNQVSIVEIISTFVKLNKRANNYLGLCPFHDDKHASLTVNEQKKIYKCFSCNNAGDVFTFVKNYKHISYQDAVLEVAKLAHLDQHVIQGLEKTVAVEHLNNINYTINETANKYFRIFLKEPQGAEALAYLNKRGLDQTILDHYQIGFAPDSNIIIDLLENKNKMVAGVEGFNPLDIKDTGIASVLPSGKLISFFKNRITFAIYNEDHKLVAFSARSLLGEGPKYINTATTKIFNKHQVLYNLNHLLDDIETDTVYLVEGFMDVIALGKLGIKNTLATMGVAFSKSHLIPLSRLVNLKNIILCFDNDEAGQNSVAKTADILLQAGYEVSVVQYLDDTKDIDEVAQKSPELAIKTMNNTIHFHKFQLLQLLKNNPINNEAARISLAQKMAAILNQCQNPYLLEIDTKWVIEQLSLDEGAFRLLIQPKINSSMTPKPPRQYKKFEVKDVVLKTDKQQKIPQIQYTELTEKEILKCCLLSSEAHELFFADCGNLIFPKNRQAINLISDYYTLHPESERITMADLSAITQDQTMLAYLSTLMIELQQQNLEYTRNKLQKVIATHVKKLIKYKQAEILMQLEKAQTPEEKAQLLAQNDKIQKLKR